MSSRCDCGGKIIFDSGEYVCEVCGKVFEGSCYHASTLSSNVFSRTFNFKRSKVLFMIKDVCDRLGLNNAILYDATYTAESIIDSGARYNGVEIAFFSLYSACKGFNPIFCERVLKEFHSMGLKVNERNCIRLLSKFWKHYSYRSFNISSYLNHLTESLRSNIFVKEYVKGFHHLNENILWSKVKENSVKFLEEYRVSGETLKVRAIASIYVSCDKVFRSYGLENPVTLKLISKHFFLDQNNLKKVVAKLMVYSYEGLAKM
ncbi:MAG: hypothetical protein H5T50_07520 [Nitrososphaeria archaeon]|nr:hypothetical protein [Nitrososphaeria archaeon]